MSDPVTVVNETGDASLTLGFFLGEEPAANAGDKATALVNPAPEGGSAVVPARLFEEAGDREHIWIARVDSQGTLSQVTRIHPGDTARVTGSLSAGFRIEVSGEGA